MREHQIVISLKPEQFEEVQRMARAAGSKSVSLFLRQKIVSTLGLTKVGSGGQVESSEADLKQVTGELRRLHRELQIFVADSLANSDYSSAVSAMENAIPFPRAVQENFLAEGAPLMPESMDINYSQNVSIPFSEAPQAMPASPPMPANPMLPGQVSMALDRTSSAFGTSSFALPTSSSAIDDSSDSFGSQSAYAIARDTNQTAQIDPADSLHVGEQDPSEQEDYGRPAYELPPGVGAPPYAIPPTGGESASGLSADGSALSSAANQQPSASGNVKPPVYSIPQAPPDANPDPSAYANPHNPSAPNPSAYANMQDPTASHPSAYANPMDPSAEANPQDPSLSMPVSKSLTGPSPIPPQIQSFAENDELEELADRAFAISPRLGPLDEAVKRFPDPLKDLLEDALLNGLDDEEYTGDSDLASTEQAAEGAQESEQIGQPIEEGSEEQQDNVANFEQDDAAQTETATVEAELEDPSYDDRAEPETEAGTPLESTDASTDAPDDDNPADPPPQIPPPISGGPPPRKRRT